jgi:hypothetical protein
LADNDVYGVDLSGQGEKISAAAPGQGMLTPPPTIASSFNGRYDGTVSGTIGSLDVSGNFHMGIRDISGSAMVNAFSLFASELGWAEGSTQGLSVYGEGNLAQLGQGGAFSFRAGQGGVSGLALAAHGLNEPGYVDISGATDGSGVTLGLSGLLDGNELYATLGGSGGKTSSTTPALGDLPAPPSIVPPEEPVDPVDPPIPPTPPILSGRYDGTISSGSIGTTAVTGKFYLRVKDFSGTPKISDVSLMVSELGWAENSTQGLSIQGSNSSTGFSGLDANNDNMFSFKAGSGGNSGLTLAAHDLTTSGYVQVFGTTDATDINLTLTGTVDGSKNVSALGAGSKAASDDGTGLPTPPTIAPRFSARYEASLTGSVAYEEVHGTAYLGIKNLSGAPTVNAVSIFVSEKGWADDSMNALSIYRAGGDDVSLSPFTTNPPDGGPNSFQFDAVGQDAAPGITVQSHNLPADELLIVSGRISSVDDTPNFDISVEGGTGTVLGGSAQLSDSVGALPVPPALGTPDFTGVYGGTLAATLMNGSQPAQATGQFNIGIGDIDGGLKVNRAEFSLPNVETGTGALVKANADFTSPLDSQKSFLFNLNQGNAAVNGGNDGWNLGVSGSINLSGQMSVSATPYRLTNSQETLTGTGSRDNLQNISNLPQ